MDSLMFIIVIIVIIVVFIFIDGFFVIVIFI